MGWLLECEGRELICDETLALEKPDGETISSISLPVSDSEVLK